MSFGGSRARYHFCSLIWTTCQKYRGASREFDQVMIHPSFYLTMARIWCRRSSRRQPPSPRYKFLGLSIFFSSGSLDSSRGKWSTSSLILAVPLYLMLLSTSCLRSSSRKRARRISRWLMHKDLACSFLGGWWSFNTYDFFAAPSLITNLLPIEAGLRCYE